MSLPGDALLLGARHAESADAEYEDSSPNQARRKNRIRGSLDAARSDAAGT